MNIKVLSKLLRGIVGKEFIITQNTREEKYKVKIPRN
jgi:hypothetical protein